MNKEKLISDLKELLESKPDKLGVFGTEYFLFSKEEINGILEVLENQ